jgi:hypothetical protein
MPAKAENQAMLEALLEIRLRKTLITLKIIIANTLNYKICVSPL